MRLDTYLSNYNTIQSRNKASELIKNKKISIDGKIVTKPSFKINGDEDIIILEEDFFVSRAAYKLKYFLEEFNINIQNKVALDIGSSTGGFTQILLRNNIKNVTCVDVGSNQLHKSIKDDKRIILKENTDIRAFKPDLKYQLITCDVSFISILNIIESINRLAQNEIIILYKPQFEVGSNVKRDSNGVVLDDISIAKARDTFIDKTLSLQWKLIHCQKSKLAGKSGNVEELFYFHL
ncbi:MAG: TlyA family RNA methyltransferase [Campylobacterota bacterium]|nr:TlyA family RNA methyltransferase [Campylobacterota bacterium]